MYKVEYLPIAKTDIEEITDYISNKLQNPSVALKLAEEIINATQKLSEMPYIHPAYYPIRPLKNEYRKLIVNNYIVFYSVSEQTKTVTIARIIYAKRNIDNLNL
jgi:addiction module RelE/StbE family toxin